MTATQHPTFTIHDRLRKAREWAQLDREGLASRLECSEGTIGNYETGATTRLKPYIVKAWAMACGVPADWIEQGDDATGPTSGGANGTSDQGEPMSTWNHMQAA